MKSTEREGLMKAFEEQERIIEAQGNIIDELFTLLSQHMAAEELCGVTRRILTVKAVQ